MGKNCEININECETNPCGKHGTCNDGVSFIRKILIQNKSLKFLNISRSAHIPVIVTRASKIDIVRPISTSVTGKFLGMCEVC